MPRHHRHHHHDRHDYDYPAPAYSNDDHDNHSKWIYVRNQEEARKLDMQDGKIDGMHEGKMIAIAKVRPVPRPAAPRRALGPCGCPFCMEYRSGPRNYNCQYYEPGTAWTGYENEVVRPRPDLATFYYSDGRASGPVDARAYGQYAVGASDYVGRSADFYSEPYYGAKAAPSYAAPSYAAPAAPTYVQSAASVAAPTYVQGPAATYGATAAPASYGATAFPGYGAASTYAAPTAGYAGYAAPTSYGTPAPGTPAPFSYGTTGFPAGFSGFPGMSSVTPAPAAAAAPAPASTPASTPAQ